MDLLLGDLRLACRQLRARPGVAGPAILALTLGLVVNAIAFSAVNAFLFKGRAGWDIDGVGRIAASGVGSSEEGLSWPEYEQIAQAARGAFTTAAQTPAALSRQRAGSTDTVWALLIAGPYFEMLQARPLAGRLLTPSDATALSAVVSERYWRDSLGAASLAGLTVTLNGLETAIVGVLPDSFEGPGGLYAPQLWLPAAARARLQPGRPDSETALGVGVVAALAPGVSVAQANALLKVAAAGLAATWPETHARRTLSFELLSEWVPELRAIARASAVGLTAVAGVLLLACLNVATLLLSRGVERQRELGIRQAVGASRAQLLRQQIVEGCVLSGIAGLVALVVTLWSQQLLSTFAIPVAMPQRLNVTPDRTVVAYTAVLMVLAGILPAVAPVLHAVRVNLTQLLGVQAATGQRQPNAARHALVFVQVAGSTMFLVAATVLVIGAIRTWAFDPGFETVRTAVVSLDPLGDGVDRRAATATLDQVVTALRAVPGIREAAIVDRAPFFIGFAQTTLLSRGHGSCVAGGCREIVTYAVGPRYFATLGIAVERGAEFRGAAGDGVIVNTALAREWFGERDPLGQTLAIGPTGTRVTITGVVRDVRLRSLTETPGPTLYLPFSDRHLHRGVQIVVRGAEDATTLVTAIHAALHRTAPQLAADQIETMTARLQIPRWPVEAASRFFAACAIVAWLLATIGVAAVMAHSVGQRTREFGVRLALGASRHGLLTQVLATSVRVAIPAIAIGMAAAYALMSRLGPAAAGIDAGDPWPYVAVAGFQLWVATLASLGPAYRAATVDPIQALRAV